MNTNITGFEGLDVKELRRTAVEDFAVEVKPNEKKPDVIAALVESGVTWADYAKVMGLEVPVAEPVAIEQPIVAPDAPVVAQEVNIITAQPLTTQTQDKYLLKMERDNPVYETQGYRFTQEHPYALVSPEAAEWILENEKGIRMARPSELQQFYG